MLVYILSSAKEMSSPSRTMDETLKISHYVERTNVLGPYDRSALWMHGCNFSCPGCIAETVGKKNATDVSCADLAKTLREVFGTEGITISGGEPFLQAAPLARLVIDLKLVRDYGVIIYTGFYLEELVNEMLSDPGVKELLGFTDILIDGRYVPELDDGKPYRGSSNQRIIQMTNRYADVFEDYYFGCEVRKTEISVSRNGITLVGVPSKAGFDAWVALENAKGILLNG